MRSLRLTSKLYLNCHYTFTHVGFVRVDNRSTAQFTPTARNVAKVKVGFFRFFVVLLKSQILFETFNYVVVFFIKSAVKGTEQFKLFFFSFLLCPFLLLSQYMPRHWVLYKLYHPYTLKRYRYGQPFVWLHEAMKYNMYPPK